MTGRPEFNPSDAQRKRVSILAAGGMAHEQIAAAIGISRTTLLKHFDGELTKGAADRKAEVLDALFKAAKKGNVAAQKAFLQRADGEVKSGRTGHLGKKEQAAAAAEEASQPGNKFAPPPAPKLVVNNS